MKHLQSRMKCAQSILRARRLFWGEGGRFDSTGIVSTSNMVAHWPIP